VPDGDGFFFEPTVVSDLKQDDEMIQNEIFGPVITVQQFSDEAEALAWANDVKYGLVRQSNFDKHDAARLAIAELRLACEH